MNFLLISLDLLNINQGSFLEESLTKLTHEAIIELEQPYFYVVQLDEYGEYVIKVTNIIFCNNMM